MVYQKYLPVFFLFLFAALVLFFFFRYTKSTYLTFSDSAKMAEVGRSLATGSGYATRFILFANKPEVNVQGLFSARVVSPLMPYLIAANFKIFGVSDVAVTSVSVFFYIVLVLATYLLGKKFGSDLVGILSATAVAADINFLSYAATGASETLFTAEIIIGLLLFTNKKIWSDIAGYGFLIVMYLTRPHAVLYFPALFFYFIQLKTNNYKKTLLILSLTILAGILVVGLSLLIPNISFGRLFVERVLVSLSSNSSFAPANSVLRISESALVPLIFSNIVPLLKKLFYNLYNFYKLLPNILSPYLVAFFIIGLFRRGKDRVESTFKIAVLATIAIVIIVNAITIPLYRYLHPLMPLIYLLAVAELVRIVKALFTNRKSLIIAAVSAFLIILFVVGQTLGYIFLDSRFINKTVNKDQPPVYVSLAKILNDHTETSDIIVTNLDTWGSWYGDRRTIWYPLEPNQLVELNFKKVSVDAIFLTSYLIGDENYYMGESWRQIFYNPTKIEDEFIAKNYKLKGVYEVTQEETYEKESARAVLLVKK